MNELGGRLKITIPIKNNDDINSQKKVWKKNVLDKSIKKEDLKEIIKSPSGIPLKQLYEPEEIKDINFFEDIGYSGKYPFTRGVYSNMYRGRLWTMRQYAGFGDAVESNKRFKYLISQGQKGLSIAFDLPTQMGYNSDNDLCCGEVGKVGVSINSLKDFENLFDGIPLDKISTSMTINAPTAVLLAMYIAIGEKQGVKPEHLMGTVQNDILKEYIARGTYIYPPEPSLRLTVDVIEYCSKYLPKFNTISISGYHMREAGANAIQEIAFTLANGITYVEEVLKRGIDIDEFAPRISFFFCVHNNIFEEIAKFRAARRLWAKIMKERFNAKDPKSLSLRFHTQTAGVALTASQMQVNIVRVTLQALAAILGGTQSLHTNSFDEALCLPTEDAVRIALRTQQVIAHETGIADVIDPIGGSYYLEFLTKRLEEEAMKYIQKIDEMGGMPIAIKKGFIQNEIQNNAYLIQKKIENGTDKVIGVNSFKTEEKSEIKAFKCDVDVEKKSITGLSELKKTRNNNVIKEKLKELKKIAQTPDNIMPIIIVLVKEYATIQEICDILREIYGKYKPQETF
ncbi:MAG: methylmalonyl-CoA mutase [Promethearchaeota archaeon]